MTWFAFPGGWGLYDLNGISEKELVATGAHGYATKAQALAKVNASPNTSQIILLQTLKASSVSPVGAGLGGDLSTPSSTGGVTGSLGDVFKFLGQKSIWLRGTEVVAGLLLMYTGVKAMTGPGVARVVPGKSIYNGAKKAAALL